MRLQAELGGAAAVGLHRRHPRGPGVRRLGDLRPPRLGRRSPDRPARRPGRSRAWCSCGWSPRRVPRGLPTRSTSYPRASCRRATCTCWTRPVPATSRSRSCTRTPSRCAGWRSSTSSPTTPTARAATCCRCATATATASTTGSASTSRTSSARCCGAGPGSGSRGRSRAGIESVLDGLAGDLREQLEDLLTVREVDAIERRSERLLSKGRFPVPAGGWPSIPWPPF